MKFHLQQRDLSSNKTRHLFRIRIKSTEWETELCDIVEFLVIYIRMKSDHVTTCLTDHNVGLNATLGILKETEGISTIFVASLHRRTCRCASCASSRAVYVHPVLR